MTDIYDAAGRKCLEDKHEMALAMLEGDAVRLKDQIANLQRCLAASQSALTKAMGELTECRAELERVQALYTAELDRTQAVFDALGARAGERVDRAAQRVAVELREAREQEREAVVLWLWDRAGQYHNSSGYVACLEERASEIMSGDHATALECGDLDDLRDRYQRARARGRVVT